MSAVAAKSNNTNFIQRNLIPEESRNVRYVMQKAAYFGNSDNLLVAHLVSVAFVVMAVAMSAFNAVSYLLQAPIKVLLNIVQFNPLGVITDLVQDLGDVAKSLLFVSLGVTLFVVGFLIPGPIFNLFSPEYYEPLEVRLELQLEEANQKLEEFEAKYNKLKELNEGRRAILIQDQETLEALKREIAALKRWKFNPLNWFRRS